MVFLRKNKLFLLAAAVFLFIEPAALYADSLEMELLVDAFVEKGLLKKDEGKAIVEKVKVKAAKIRAAENAPQIKGPSGNGVNVTFDDRLRFETSDETFKGHIGGELQIDMMCIKGQGPLTNLIRPTGDFNQRNNGAIIRRARFCFDGTFYKNFFYSFEYDVAGQINNNEVDGFQGAFIGMKNIPYLGTLKAGQMKEPFGLEWLTRNTCLTFMERSLSTDALVPGFSWGAALENNWFDKRATFALGAFRTSSSSATMALGNEWNLTTRGTVLPWYAANDKLLHLGAAYSYRTPVSRDNYIVRFRSRPEIYTTDRFADTGSFQFDSENLLGMEGAVVYGPLSLQGEIVQAWLDQPNGHRGDGKIAHLYGGYGYISYFLTGESRNYDRSSGVFESVRPNNNFSLNDRTWGAWELASRFSYLCLNDKSMDISGGILYNFTTGINWYINPNMEIMFNYVHTTRNGVGYADGIETRAQVTF